MVGGVQGKTVAREVKGKGMEEAGRRGGVWGGR